MTTPIRLFVGVDPREQVGLHVFCHSVWSRASVPVSITPIHGKTDGTNAFTLSRFLVPYLCGFNGWAIWADGSDMLCLADIKELIEMVDYRSAVQVVKHDYKTNHPIKYLGQKNEDYPRKNWSSLILWNCGHYGNRKLRPEYVAQQNGQHLHRFAWTDDQYIGSIPPEWNYLCMEPNQHGPAKIAHYTIGLPVWYPDCEYADEWRKEREAMTYFQEWK